MKNLKLLLLFVGLIGITYSASAQLKVGDNPTTLNSSAVLEAESGNKGFLPPRIALASRTDVTTIPSPAVGLLIYNTGTAGLSYAGYVYWNGSEWRNLNNSSLVEGAISSLVCNSINFTPPSYTAGTPYSGTLKVPYTGGNGGVYTAQTIGPVNGLTATLAPGSFNVGSGELAYSVTGTPTVSSPTTTTFPINIGGATCNAVVGLGSSYSQGQMLFYKASFSASVTGWMSSYVSDLPVLGGVLRLDAFFNASSNAGNGNVSMFPRLVNISSQPVKIWFSAMSTVDNFNAGNYLLAGNPGYVELDNGIYYGYGFDDIVGTSTPRASGFGQAGNQEVLTVDLSINGEWYRINYFPIVDNKNTASTADNTREIFLSIQRLY